MSTLLLQPQISINSDGRLNGAFLTFFSKAATEERFVAVRECRWQANRIIEEAPKLYKDSDYYIKMNKTCLSCPYQPRAFLTPKGKNKMEDHSLFARYLEYSANYVLTKFCWIFVTFSLSCQIHTDILDELFCLLFSVKDDSTRENLFSYFRYWVALHGAFKSYPNREKTATAA